MWVTQSYLGDPDKDPKVYAYYLFEDYAPEQEVFTKDLEARLAHVGDQFGPHATILMPNRYNAPRIEAEVSRALGEFWHELRGRLPGLLVTTTKLSEFRHADGNNHFFSLAQCDRDSAAEIVMSVHRLMQQCVEYEHAKEKVMRPEKLFDRFIASVEAKPGIAGFRFDLRKFFNK